VPCAWRRSASRPMRPRVRPQASSARRFWASHRGASPDRRSSHPGRCSWPAGRAVSLALSAWPPRRRSGPVPDMRRSRFPPTSSRYSRRSSPRSCRSAARARRGGTGRRRPSGSSRRRSAPRRSCSAPGWGDHARPSPSLASSPPR
jgi:hypothetical protein